MTGLSERLNIVVVLTLSDLSPGTIPNLLKPYGTADQERQDVMLLDLQKHVLPHARFPSILRLS
jgi:hypothetical protein